MYSDTQSKLIVSDVNSSFRFAERVRFIILCLKMSNKERCSSVNSGIMLSAVCLLLYSAGFVRIELKFNDHDRRLEAVEEAIILLKHGMAKTSNEGIMPLDPPLTVC